MRVLPAAVMAAFAALMISGCTGHEQMESMGSEKGGMESMEKTMKDETMMEDPKTESMRPKMESMEKTMKDDTMMEDSKTESMQPKMESMDKAGQ
jgi:hypothetical protein